MFRYIWNGTYQPIKRETFYLDKTEGGIGVINVYYKAAAILSSIFMNIVTLEVYGYPLTLYYSKNKIGDVLVVEGCYSGSNTLTPYYQQITETVMKSCNLSGFPKVKAKHVHRVLKPPHKPIVEERYPLFNWCQVWSNLNLKFIDSYKKKYSCTVSYMKLWL